MTGTSPAIAPAVLYPGADASQPGNPLPPGTRILAAYVGIAGMYGPDTPHIWTAGEWNEYIQEDPEIRQLPVYTHNYPGNPIGDANNAADACERLGWAPHLQGDQRRIIAVDLEIFIDPPYVADLFEQIDARGFAPMPYGSAGFVRGNPMGIGYWISQLTRFPPAVLPQNTQGVQWTFGPQWDLNMFSQRVYDGCGRGMRHG